jgi:hypothetical protein
MEMQHVTFKLLLENPAQLDLENLIPIFHGWIGAQAREELLVDVADYRHVFEGPGIVVIGHQADYSVDNTGGRLGVRYHRKAPLAGTNQQRLAQAATSALAALLDLEADPRLEGKLRFNGRDFDVFINDRRLAPNTPATREALASDFSGFLEALLGSAAYDLSCSPDPRELLGWSVKTLRPYQAAELLENLSALAPAWPVA